MEWKFNKKWNPFNSAKLLAHVERWSKIVRGQEIPPPVTVTIDPTNKCNLNCQWCNAKQVRQGGGEISLKVLTQIVKFLGEWGVKAVCIAGGGEPTLHSGFGELISMLMAENIRIGVVTNGTYLDDWQQYLLYCDWVGVSIDAGNSGTYEKYKGRDEFQNVIEQSNRLIDMARGLNRPLAQPGLGNGVFYKFLVNPDNIPDMVSATQIAEHNGFKAIHFRPVGHSWDLDDKTVPLFSSHDISGFNAGIASVTNFWDKEGFSVYGVNHKFKRDLTPLHNFEKCRAVFMTCVFMPPSKFGDVDVGLCCDRRGDEKMNLVTSEPVDNLRQAWGGEHHWAIADKIKPCQDCPRCTYAPHNEIFENVIEQDNMTLDFI